MIIKLSNGKKIILADVVRDPRAKAIEWLREYRDQRESLGPIPGSKPQSTREELYDENHSITS